jgi:hypothetical protein
MNQLKNLLFSATLLALAGLAVAGNGGDDKAALSMLKQWSGTYSGRSDDFLRAKLTLAGDGTFALEFVCMLGSGDAGTGDKAHGTAALHDGWLRLTPAPRQARCPLPSGLDLYPLRVKNRYLLAGRRDLLGSVNRMHTTGIDNGFHALTRARKTADDPLDGIQIRKESLPEPYRHMVLMTPLAGVITEVRELKRETAMLGDPMRNPKPGIKITSRIRINLGADQGVFEGMSMYSMNGFPVLRQVSQTYSEADIFSYSEAQIPTRGTVVFSTSAIPVDMPNGGKNIPQACRGDGATLEMGKTAGRLLCRFK